MVKLLDWNGDESIFNINKKYIVFASTGINGYDYNGFTLLFYYNSDWRLGSINNKIYTWDNIKLDFIIECDGDYN